MTAPSPSAAHVPVLAHQVVRLLNPAPGDVYVDLTLGMGGYAALMAERIGLDGVIVGFDLDGFNIAAATARLHGA